MNSSTISVREEGSVSCPGSVHLVGVLGKGQLGLAQLLDDRGWQVSGSDQNVSKGGALGGINVFVGHTAENVPTGVKSVVISAAIQRDNPEVKEAIRRGVPVWERSQFLRHYLKGEHLVSIVGSQGKTTTTALLGQIFKAAARDPGALVGASIPGWNHRSALSGRSIFFAETCEHSRQLMDFYPKEIVLTHIDSSFHPETFASPSDAVRTFATFVTRLPLNGGVIYYNGDCEVQRSIAGFCPGRRISYGFGKDCQVRGIEVIRHRMGSSFQIEFDGQNLAGEFFTPLPGEWNVKNAIAAIAVALHHGVPVKEIQAAVANFSGISRRYDVLCDKPDSSTIIEHLTFQPPVVRDLISETRHRYPEKRCVVIFNSYDVLVLQRQKAEYASAFRNADHVIIRPVQPAFQQSTEMASQFDLSGLADQIRLLSKTTVEISSNLEADAIQLARAEITRSRQTAFLVIGPPGRQLAENFAREVTES